MFWLIHAHGAINKEIAVNSSLLYFLNINVTIHGSLCLCCPRSVLQGAVSR